MPTPIIPKVVSAFGAWKWIFVPTIADTQNPKLSELNATGSLDLSCFLYPSSTFPTQDANMFDRSRKLCQRQTSQGVGAVKITGGELHYGWDPQGAVSSNDKKAWTVLGGATGTTTGFLVGRVGKLSTVDFAVGDFVDVYAVGFSYGASTNENDDDAAEAAVIHPYGVVDPNIGRNVALVA